MFRSQIMRRVELVVPEQDVVQVTEALAASGIFHLTRSEFTGDEVLNSDSKWHTWVTEFTGLERRIMSVFEALGVKTGSPPKTAHLIEPGVAQRDIEHLEQEIQIPLHEMEAAQRRLAQLERYRTQLEPIRDLDIDLSVLRKLRYTYIALGMIPTANVERLRSSLEHVPFGLVTLQRTENLTVVVLFGLQRDAQILDRSARSAYLNPLNLPETYRGSPTEAIAALHAGIERTRQHIVETKAELEQLQKLYLRRLRHLLWRVRASRKLVETILKYGRLRYTYLIAGWVPAPKVELLKQQLEVVSQNVSIEVTTPQCDSDAPRDDHIIEDEDIPVALNNPPLIRAFQGLVTTYGYPRYGELDPVMIVALTFPLIFGIMFGDVGHGLLLTAAGLLIASRKVRSLRRMSNMGVVVAVCGVSAIVFGFLYGSIFGFEDVLKPLWMQPLENIMDILLVTVGVGVGLLNLGMLYNIINHAMTKRWGRMLFDRNGLAGILFYWSLLGLVAGMFVPNFPVNASICSLVAVVAGIGITFSTLFERLLEKKRPLVEGGAMYLMEAFFELFETVIGFLSNTLSYVRMGAFAVAHGALSLVVFIIAEIASPTRGFGYWIVVALGNLFVIGFEGMIVGIQTLRLEYYEFFSKFFVGGGSRYHPLSLLSQEWRDAPSRPKRRERALSKLME
ncbi:MAG: hypothetical protein JXA21_12155 [Anaerolineae bacterium]|nr:hypothetical protein [Anaerolineae bacterium]